MRLGSMIKLGSPVEFVGVVVSCGTTANEDSATKVDEEEGLVSYLLAHPTWQTRQREWAKGRC
jgi:hypothetical protein